GADSELAVIPVASEYLMVARCVGISFPHDRRACPRPQPQANATALKRLRLPLRHNLEDFGITKLRQSTTQPRAGQSPKRHIEWPKMGEGGKTTGLSTAKWQQEL